MSSLVTFTLKTAAIPTAIFADRLRKLALVIIKDVPRDVILRDIAEFNKHLYTYLSEELKLSKSDLIRITVDVSYDKEQNKLIFSRPKIDRYVPEGEIKAFYEKIIEEYKKQVAELNSKIEQIKKEYEEEISNLKKDKENLKVYYENKLKENEEEINKIKNEILKYKEKIENVKKELTNILKILT
jgi:hypothetical protein